MKKGLFYTVFLILLLGGNLFSADWLAGWFYRKAISIDHSKVNSNLTDFPVFVKLNDTNFDFSRARNDGFDIRFTSSDGTTLLKYERERHKNRIAIDLESSESQYLRCTDHTALSITGNISMEMWIKLEQLPSIASSSMSIAGKWDPGNNKRCYLLLIGASNDKLTFSYSADGIAPQQYTMDEAFDTYDIGEWIHIAITAEVATETVNFYKNGLSMDGTIITDNNQTSIYNSDGNFEVGARKSGTVAGLFFDGSIDEVRLWNDIRTPTEILNNYEEEITVTEPNLVGYWKFNNNANDETSNGNDLTEINNPNYSSQSAEYWVKIPSVSSTTNTMFYMYYGNSGASDDADPVNVWDANYVGVWHKNDATSTTIADATSYANHGTKKGIGEPTEIEGKIGKSQSFDGVDDYVDMGDPISLNTDYVTVTAWFKPNTVSGTSAPVSKASGTGDMSWQFYQTGTTIGFWVNNGTTYNNATALSSLSTGNWVHFSGTWDGSTIRAYFNGNLEKQTSFSGTLKQTDFHVYTGRRTDGYYYDCSIDEVHISNIARSPAWIKADYHSGNNTLLSFYAEQTSLSFDYRKSITINNTSGSILYDYQIPLTLDTQTPILEGNLKADSSDLRFSSTDDWDDNNWIVSYPYWVENGWNTSSSNIWVKVDEIPTGTSTIYMYYGNDSAEIVCSGDETFLFFEDFEDGDMDGWEGTTTSFSVNTSNPFEGNRSLYSGTSGAGTRESMYYTRSENAKVVEGWLYDVTDGLNAVPALVLNRQPDDESYYGAVVHSSGETRLESMISNSFTIIGSGGDIGSEGSWYFVRFTNDDGDLTGMFYDDSYTMLDSIEVTDMTYTDGYAGVRAWGAREAYFDLFRGRKYVSSQPSITNISEEELSSSPITIDWNNGNVQTITLQGNASFTFTNGIAGGVYWLILNQDEIGNRIAIWDSIIKWQDDTPPVLSTSPDKKDFILFLYDGENYLGDTKLGY